MEQTLRKRGYMNKYIRSFPTFLVIREIHFKAKMRYNFTTTDNTKRLTVLVIGRDRATGALRQRWWEHKTAQLLNLNPHLSHDPAIPLLGSQNKYPLEILKNVHRNFIHDSPKLQATPISTNREMDRQIVLYLYNGILHSNKKEWKINAQKHTGETQKHYVEWKKHGTEYVLCGSIYMRFKERKN